MAEHFAVLCAADRKWALVTSGCHPQSAC